MDRKRLRLKDVFIATLLSCTNILIFTKEGNVFIDSISNETHLDFAFYMVSIVLASSHLNSWAITISCISHIIILLILSFSGFVGLLSFFGIVYLQIMSLKKFGRKANIFGTSYITKRMLDDRAPKASSYDFYVTACIFLGFAALTILGGYQGILTTR